LLEKQVKLLSENESSYITYSQKHIDIVMKGIDSINEVLDSTDVSEKRSLLFCLDKYLDPYYGYNLPCFEEIMLLLQQRLFVNEAKEVKEDIMQLITEYSGSTLDYLAEKIADLDSELLPEALYALSLTFNKKYGPILWKYADDYKVGNIAKTALEWL
jgi:hypothetical protein